METKLCRICGKLGQNYSNIFKTEGLKYRIETCLPIIVSQHSLLPDTICEECVENVDNFYSFIKHCLQNIIIIESQYDITESCLKTKRRYEKGCMTNISNLTTDQNIQTDDYIDLLVTKYAEEYNLNIDGNKPSTLSSNGKYPLVDYEIDSEVSDTEVNSQNNGKLQLPNDFSNIKIDNFVDNLLSMKTCTNKQYFDDVENNLINEINQRKVCKRKGNVIESYPTKICKLDTSSRRKSKQPKKVEYKIPECQNEIPFDIVESDINTVNEYHPIIKTEATVTEHDVFEQVEKDMGTNLFQICLLCETQFSGPTALAAHVFEIHGIDMAQIVLSAENSADKRKKLPNLLKISDLKKSDSIDDDQSFEQVQLPTVQDFQRQSLVCPLCSLTCQAKFDLYTHLRIKHSQQASLMCGLCTLQTTSLVNLKTHVNVCVVDTPVTRYHCQICKYGEDNAKSLENHVLVHDFLLETCKKQLKMFDPSDYIELNSNCDLVGSAPILKGLSCSECNLTNFESFKDFSTHRRNQHSIFHCDLCNKFYGRNSHLWKHVNRLHKGHPSVTCQICYKTSASKYHLSQHFNKIHITKGGKIKTEPIASVPSIDGFADDFMSQKFQAFDFQSVKQSFMRQELLKREKKSLGSDFEENSTNHQASDPDESEGEINNYVNVKSELLGAPKEIDTSSDLYTNIITNYTPPPNEGDFKCPKCGKGFVKKLMLKKHKKNCRPRLQKDLLTRCKSCARIFKDRQSLAKHLVNYHSEYACEICGQKAQSKCEIVAHIRFTHPGCQLACRLCGNILRSQSNLAEHLEDHCNSYVCQFCADPLPSKIKLKMHILSLHRKILSLSCGICLKLFENQHMLRNHVRLVHGDELTPLTSCPVCGKNYGSKWKTFDHLNKSHGRIFKACKTCLDVFDTEQDLQDHYENCHANRANKIKTSEIAQTPVPPAIKRDVVTESEGDEESEDARSDDTPPLQLQPPPEQRKAIQFDDIFARNVKISLLEKRLLGKKVNEDESNNHFVAKKNDVIQTFKVSNEFPHQHVPQTVEKISNDATIPRKYEDNDSSPNPQYTSSKRTVYVNSDAPSLCEICLKTWPAKKHLWQHYIRCHKSVAATVCGICLKTNLDYSMLQRHLRENHPTLLHGQGFGSNFICRICGRYHNASSKLKLHMAIHENFDWNLLEVAQETKSRAVAKKDRAIKTNGYDKAPSPKIEMYEDASDINYESLIEQVECSSDSDEDSDNETPSNNEVKLEIGTSSDDDDEVIEETENEESVSGNSAKVGEDATTNVYVSSESDDTSESSVKSENASSGRDSRISNSTNEDENSTMRTISDPNPDSNGTMIVEEDIFTYKMEELDSAVKSICFEGIHEIKNEMDFEYPELQMQSLNEHEIESAVGSIL